MSINLSSSQHLIPEFSKDKMRSLPCMRSSVWQKTRLVGVRRTHRFGSKLQLTLLSYRTVPRDAVASLRFSGLRVQTSSNSNKGFLPSPTPALTLATKFSVFTAHPILALLSTAQVAVFMRYIRNTQQLALINRSLLSFVLSSPQSHPSYSTSSLAHLLPRRPHFVRFSLNNV